MAHGAPSGLDVMNPVPHSPPRICKQFCKLNNKMNLADCLFAHQGVCTAFGNFSVL